MEMTKNKGNFINNMKKALKETFNLKLIANDLLTLKGLSKLILLVMIGFSFFTFIHDGVFNFKSITSLITGIIGVINLMLVNEGKLSNYAFGVFSCTSQLIVVLQSNLIGDIFSQIFYVVMQFVGLYEWSLNIQDDGRVESKKLTKSAFIKLFLISGIVYFATLAISFQFNSLQKGVDALLLPLSIIGQVLMTYGYKSQWIFWLIYDLLEVYIWFNNVFVYNIDGASIMLVMYIIYTINVAYGFHLWNIEYRKRQQGLVK